MVEKYERKGMEIVRRQKIYPEKITKKYGKNNRGKSKNSGKKEKIGKQENRTTIEKTGVGK